MSLQLSIEAYLDDARARAQQRALEETNKKIAAGIKENEKQSKAAYDKSVGAMRASYMMISGFSDVIGGNMMNIFSTVYGVGVASITMLTAIAEAQFFIPGMQLQSTMMVVSLLSALASLGGVITGQMALSNQLNGLNVTLSGFSGLLDSMNFG